MTMLQQPDCVTPIGHGGDNAGPHTAGVAFHVRSLRPDHLVVRGAGKRDALSGRVDIDTADSQAYYRTGSADTSRLCQGRYSDVRLVTWPAPSKTRSYPIPL